MLRSLLWLSFLGIPSSVGCLLLPSKPNQPKPIDWTKVQPKLFEAPRSPYHPKVMDLDSPHVTNVKLVPLNPEELPQPKMPLRPNHDNEESQELTSKDAAQAGNVEPFKAEDEPVVLAALRAYLEQQPEKALEHLRKLDPEDQEMMTLLLPLIANSQKQSVTKLGPRSLAGQLKQLRYLVQRLSARAQLSLKNVCFCQAIGRYGFYRPITHDASFYVGRQDRVGEKINVYAEVENFRNLPKGSFFETTLAVELSILDTHGKRVWFASKFIGPERSRSPRRDLFLHAYFHVPAQLPVGGRYVLHLDVRDVTGQSTSQTGNPNREVPAHRRAETTLDFDLRVRE